MDRDFTLGTDTIIWVLFTFVKNLNTQMFAAGFARDLFLFSTDLRGGLFQKRSIERAQNLGLSGKFN